MIALKKDIETFFSIKKQPATHYKNLIIDTNNAIKMQVANFTSTTLAYAHWRQCKRSYLT